MAPENAHHLTNEERLDEIIRRLKHMDNRDRLRTWGSFVRSLLWIALIVGSTYYFIENGAQLMQKLVEQSASAAAKYSSEQGSSMVEGLLKQYQFKH